MLTEKITNLIKELSVDLDVKEYRIIQSVFNTESDLFFDRTNNYKINDKDTFFYSAIGRVRNQYKTMGYKKCN